MIQGQQQYMDISRNTLLINHELSLSEQLGISRSKDMLSDEAEIYAQYEDIASICSLQWRHNWCDGVSNHQHLECLFKRLLRRRLK